MIVASAVPVPVGSRGVGIWDCDGLHPGQPYVVLREASLDEFVADITDRGWPVPTTPCPYRFFYDVSVD